jgi:tRNA-dihydrouridine synthase
MSTEIVNTLKSQLNIIRTKALEKEGEKIYKENDFISKIYDIMTDSVFSDFFNTYIKSHTDVEVMIIFMHTYKIIQEQYKNIYGENISKNVMAFYLRESMRNRTMRKFFIKATKDSKLLADEKHKMTTCVSKMIKDKQHTTEM